MDEVLGVRERPLPAAAVGMALGVTTLLPLLSLPSPLGLLEPGGGWRGVWESSTVREERDVPLDRRHGVPSSLNCRALSRNTPPPDIEPEVLTQTLLSTKSLAF